MRLRAPGRLAPTISAASSASRYASARLSCVHVPSGSIDFGLEPSVAPLLEQLAALSEDEFRDIFRHSPVRRARYAGFLRNVALAMGNARQESFRAPLEKLAASTEPLVAEAARWGLARL